MKILVFNKQKDLPIKIPSVKRVVKEILSLEDQIFDEVAIYFVSSEEICRLHQEFFDDPSPTDCISFPMDSHDDPGHRILGEVFVCPKTAMNYLESKKNAPDVYQEMTLYVVHGLLHLLGYNDIKKADVLKMRKAEVRHLQNLIDSKALLAS